MAGPAYALSVDIGGTKTAVSLWTLEAGPRGKKAFPTPSTSEATLRGIANSIAALLAEAGLAKEAIAGIGVSCGGPLDSRRGLVLSPPNLPGWDAVPVTRLLEEATGLPAWLENDANACALAEWYWGAGRGARDMVFLTFGTGLGAGLILDGRLYRGACDLAGEVGHVRLAEDGPSGYGKRGSWEGFCSGGGIARLGEEETGIPRTTREVCEAARAGDEGALAVLATSSRYLGRGLALLIDILNPERIVIGSVFARSGDLFRPGMEAELALEALGQARLACSIVPAELGEELGDMAALGIVMDRLGRRGAGSREEA